MARRDAKAKELMPPLPIPTDVSEVPPTPFDAMTSEEIPRTLGGKFAQQATFPTRRLEGKGGGEAYVLSGEFPVEGVDPQPGKEPDYSVAQAYWGSTPEEFTQLFGGQIYTDKYGRTHTYQPEAQADPERMSPSDIFYDPSVSRYTRFDIPGINGVQEQTPQVQTEIDIFAGDRLTTTAGVNTTLLDQAARGGTLTGEQINRVWDIINNELSMVDVFELAKDNTLQAIGVLETKEEAGTTLTANERNELNELKERAKEAQRNARQRGFNAQSLAGAIGRATDNLEAYRTTQAATEKARQGAIGGAAINRFLQQIFPNQIFPDFADIPSNKQTSLLNSVFAMGRAARDEAAKVEGKTTEEIKQERFESAADFINKLFPDLNVDASIFGVPSGVLSFLAGMAAPATESRAKFAPTRARQGVV